MRWESVNVVSCHLTHCLSKLLCTFDADRLPGAIHAGELLVEELAPDTLFGVIHIPHVVPVGTRGPSHFIGGAIWPLGNHLDLVGRDPG